MTRRLAVIPGLALIVVAIIAQAFNLWSVFGVPAMPPGAADLRGVLDGAQCYREYGILPLTHSPCDQSGWLVYPSLWARSLAPLGIPGDWARPLGLVGAFVLAIALGALYLAVVRPQARIRQAVAATLIAVSAPALLMVERANVDEWIFAAIVVALWLLNAGRLYWVAGLVAVTAALKYSTIGGLLPLARRGRLRPLAFGLVIVVAATIPFLREVDFATMQKVGGSCQVSFGVSIVPRCLPPALGMPGLAPWASHAIGLALLLLVAAASAVTVRRWPVAHQAYTSLLDECRGDRRLWDQAVFGLGLLLTTYLTGVVWDYKWLFLAPAALVLVGMGSRLGWLMAAGLGLALLMSGYSGRLELLGDLVLLVVVGGLVVVLAGLMTERERVGPGGS